MLAFIHNNFRLDLTFLQVTFNDENQWFKDDFFTEITFPFEFYLDSDLTRASGFDHHYNSINRVSSFNGILEKDGVMVEAVLKFENKIGKKISAVLKSGSENFPSFDKKLSELPLEKKSLTDLWSHAADVLLTEYPESNYNFPMIHTDKYASDGGEFNGFEKTINKYINGAWVQNILDSEENVDIIKNIIQPLPYQMHVLKAGIESAGYTLEGDILEDEDIKKALIFRDGSYYNATAKTEIPFKVYNNEWNSLAYVDNTFQYVSFMKELTVEKKGDYLLYGSIYCLIYTARKNPAWSHRRYRCSKTFIRIEKISGSTTTVLYNFDQGRDDDGTNNLMWDVQDNSIEIESSFNPGDIIRITKIEPRRDYVPSITPEYPEAVSLDLFPLRYRNPDGSPILSVLPLNEIDLTKVVPDMTFRDFVLVLKNWGNYGFIADGKVIRMDRVGEKLDRTKAFDFTEFENPEPKENFHDERQYELAFSDGISEKYKYDSVLVTKDSTTINNYSTNDNTNQIKIDALPLPILNRESIVTAHNFEDQTNKLRLVYMKKMPVGGSPVCFLNTNVLIPAIAQTHFKKWLEFRINSSGYEWDFVISVEKMREITTQSLIYAYANYHVFSELQKERLNNLWWRVTAKTETLI